jgi:hypothetical protein
MTVKRLTKADHPQSFGAFKPVGHVVVAMHDDTSAEAATAALRGLEFEDADILHYSAAEEDSEMALMLQGASDFAGFGYELTLMRRYQALARDGCSWLLVFAPDDARAARVADVAQRFGANTSSQLQPSRASAW